MKHLDNLRSILTPFLTDNKKIGFFVSGGFDSSLLLYTSLMLIQEIKISIITKIFTVPRYDDSRRHAENVIGFINKKFKKNLQHKIVGNPNIHHSLQVLSGIKEVIGQVDYLFLGDTKNPEHLLNGPIRIKSTDNRIIQPFFHWTKKDTVALAIELGLTDLMTISHTCTESIEYRCRHCWQCEERRWAFTENNYVDPGEK
jgi:hypothetical protein